MFEIGTISTEISIRKNTWFLIKAKFANAIFAFLLE